MAATDLYALCSELLDACVVALDTTPEGAPDCRYISPGPPSWDTCPCLVVYASGPAVADTFPLQPMLAPGHRPQTQGLVILAGLVVTILRCAPMIDDAGTLPQPAEISATALTTTSDVWAIWNHLLRQKRSAALFAPREREMFMDPGVAVIQQGGCCGWQIGLRVALGGYTP